MSEKIYNNSEKIYKSATKSATRVMFTVSLFLFFIIAIFGKKLPPMHVPQTIIFFVVLSGIIYWLHKQKVKKIVIEKKKKKEIEITRLIACKEWFIKNPQALLIFCALLIGAFFGVAFHR